MKYKNHDHFITAKKINGTRWFFCWSDNGVDMFKKNPLCADRDSYLYHGEARDLTSALRWAETSSFVVSA